MKKYSAFSLIVILLSALFFVACEKDRIEEPEEQPESKTEYESADEYFDSKKTEEQEFVVENEDGPEPITGKEGTKIHISKNCLEFPNGDTVGFPYTVKLVELYKPKDMVFWEMPTVASKKILDTDGEVRVRAFKDGTELQLNGKCPLVVELPNSSPDPTMQVYLGDGVTPTNWTSTNINFDTTAYGYSADISKLGWINVDKLPDPGVHIITFESDSAVLTQVKIFIYFPSIGGVMQVYDQVSYLIPNAYDVKTFGIANDASKNLFYFSSDLNVTSNVTLKVVLSPTTDAALTTFLDGL